MLIWLLLIGFAAILIYGFVIQNNEAKVDLRIATFGLDISVYDLRLGYKSFSIFVDYDNSGNKIQHFGNTIGEIQFNISKACKRRAQERDGNNFNKYDKDYRRFTVGVEKDGERLTYSQYVNLTTSQMRSTKNPIASIGRYKHSAPMSGYGEIIHRKKL